MAASQYTRLGGTVNAYPDLRLRIAARVGEEAGSLPQLPPTSRLEPLDLLPPFWITSLRRGNYPNFSSFFLPKEVAE